MSDDVARFRKHAFECRRLAAETKDPGDRQMLVEIAEDLEAEVERLGGSGEGDKESP